MDARLDSGVAEHRDQKLLGDTATQRVLGGSDAQCQRGVPWMLQTAAIKDAKRILEIQITIYQSYTHRLAALGPMRSAYVVV